MGVKKVIKGAEARHGSSALILLSLIAEPRSVGQHLRTEKMIRRASHDDAGEIARIYNHYIEGTVVTFEEVAVTPEEISVRMGDGHDPRYPWFVCEVEGEIRGYAYAGIWKGRCSFRRTVEATVYLDHGAVGGGFGTALYRRLIEELEENGIHAVIGGVSLPNAASVALHEKLGFEKVGHFKEVGRKFDRWVDVGYWQLLLPRERAGAVVSG